MEDQTYTARIVISAGYRERLDMSITCENAQQLLRARNTISDQINNYVAEFAIQSGLNAKPANRPNPNAEALQEVVTESVEKAKAAAADDPEETPEEDDSAEDAPAEESAPAPEPPPLVAEKPKQRPQEGTKGLMKLRCPGCGDSFIAFLKEQKLTWVCKECGHVIPLTDTALFEFDCQTCGKHTFGRTNIEDADFTFPCGGCNTEIKLTWDPKVRKYTG